jgi:hypothetical protein
MDTTYQATSTSQAVAVHPTDNDASTPFAFTVVGAVGLSVICAIAALVQIRHANEGRGLAIAGLVVSAGWIGLYFALAHAHVI